MTKSTTVSASVLIGGRAYSHVVRDVIVRDGKHYGWVWHQGGDWVVRRNERLSDDVGLEMWRATDEITIGEVRGDRSR